MNEMEKFCPDIEILARWVEGSLSPEERGRLESHLAACDECRRAAVLAEGVEAPASGTVNEALLGQVVAASRRRRWAPTVAAAAAGLAAVGLGLFLVRRSPAPAPEPAVARREAPIEERPAAPPRTAPADLPAPLPKESPARTEPVEKPAAPAVRPTEAPAPAPGPAAGPKPAPPAPAPAEPPPAVPAPPAVAKEGPTLPAAPADSQALAPVFVLDTTGDLWLRRDEAETRAGTRERMSWKDLMETRSAGAAFTLEARTSVVLEKGSEVAFSRLKADDTYSLAIGQGLVMLDTEGSTQRWRISFGSGEVRLSEFNGRLAVESHGDHMSALLLEGSAELKVGSVASKAQVGQEVVLSRAGQVVEQRVETQKKLARLNELRPRVFTAFATTFNEKRDESQPYPYSIVAGRLVQGPAGFFLQSEVQPARAGEKSQLLAELRLGRSFGMLTGMVLRLHYRSTLPKLSVKIGKFSVDHTSKVKAGQWADAEIPLREFSFEGTPMLPTDPVEDVQISGQLDRRSGLLEIDGVQFLRRVR